MTLSRGQVLQDRYRIEDSIHKGGYGAVYLATDTLVDIRCAVKENLDSDPNDLCCDHRSRG